MNILVLLLILTCSSWCMQPVASSSLHEITQNKLFWDKFDQCPDAVKATILKYYCQNNKTLLATNASNLSNLGTSIVIESIPASSVPGARIINPKKIFLVTKSKKTPTAENLHRIPELPCKEQFPSLQIFHDVLYAIEKPHLFQAIFRTPWSPNHNLLIISLKHPEIIQPIGQYAINGIIAPNPSTTHGVFSSFDAIFPQPKIPPFHYYIINLIDPEQPLVTLEKMYHNHGHMRMQWNNNSQITVQEVTPSDNNTYTYIRDTFCAHTGRLITSSSTTSYFPSYEWHTLDETDNTNNTKPIVRKPRPYGAVPIFNRPTSYNPATEKYLQHPHYPNRLWCTQENKEIIIAEKSSYYRADLVNNRFYIVNKNVFDAQTGTIASYPDNINPICDPNRGWFSGKFVNQFSTHYACFGNTLYDLKTQQPLFNFKGKPQFLNDSYLITHEDKDDDNHHAVYRLPSGECIAQGQSLEWLHKSNGPQCILTNDAYNICYLQLVGTDKKIPYFKHLINNTVYCAVSHNARYLLIHLSTYLGNSFHNILRCIDLKTGTNHTLPDTINVSTIDLEKISAHGHSWFALPYKHRPESVIYYNPATQKHTGANYETSKRECPHGSNDLIWIDEETDCWSQHYQAPLINELANKYQENQESFTAHEWLHDDIRETGLPQDKEQRPRYTLDHILLYQAIEAYPSAFNPEKLAHYPLFQSFDGEDKQWLMSNVKEERHYHREKIAKIYAMRKIQTNTTNPQDQS